jgi:hypothetical protein
MAASVSTEPDTMLEREREVDRVRRMLRTVGRREGVVVVIEGAAGIGKSRLLEVGRTTGSALGFRVPRAGRR